MTEIKKIVEMTWDGEFDEVLAVNSECDLTHLMKSLCWKNYDETYGLHVIESNLQRSFALAWWSSEKFSWYATLVENQETNVAQLRFWTGEACGNPQGYRGHVDSGCCPAYLLADFRGGRSILENSLNSISEVLYKKEVYCGGGYVMLITPVEPMDEFIKYIFGE